MKQIKNNKFFYWILKYKQAPKGLSLAEVANHPKDRKIKTYIEVVDETISLSKSIVAALMNPVNSLRSE